MRKFLLSGLLVLGLAAPPSALAAPPSGSIAGPTWRGDGVFVATYSVTISECDTTQGFTDCGWYVKAWQQPPGTACSPTWTNHIVYVGARVHDGLNTDTASDYFYPDWPSGIVCLASDGPGPGLHIVASAPFAIPAPTPAPAPAAPAPAPPASPKVAPPLGNAKAVERAEVERRTRIWSYGFGRAAGDLHGGQRPERAHLHGDVALQGPPLPQARGGHAHGRRHVPRPHHEPVSREASLGRNPESRPR